MYSNLLEDKPYKVDRRDAVIKLLGITEAQYNDALIAIQSKLGSTILTLNFDLYIKHFKDYFKESAKLQSKGPAIELSSNFFDVVITQLDALEKSLSMSNLTEHKDQRVGVTRVREILNSALKAHLCQEPSMFGGCVSGHCFAQLINGKCPFHSGIFVLNRQGLIKLIDEPTTSKYLSDITLPIGVYTVVECGKATWNRNETYFVTLVGNKSNDVFTSKNNGENDKVVKYFIRSGAIFKQVLQKNLNGPIQPPRQFDIEMRGGEYKAHKASRKSADIVSLS